MSIRRYIIAAVAAAVALLPARGQAAAAAAAAADSSVSVIDAINAGGNIVVEMDQIGRAHV